MITVGFEKIKMEIEYMKNRITLTILIGAIVLAFAGCDGEVAEEDSASEENEIEEEVTEVVAELVSYEAGSYVVDQDIPAGEYIIFESKKNADYPEYYEEHMKEKTEKIRNHEIYSRGDSFVFITDAHADGDYNAFHFEGLIRNVWNNTGVRMVVSGGDNINSTNDVESMLLLQREYASKFEFAGSNFINVIGNHEWYTDPYNPDGDRPTYDELYNTLSKRYEDTYDGKGAMNSYFFDNRIQKIRYFVLPCDFNCKITEEQVVYFLEELENVPDGYSVVLFTHAPLIDDATALRVGYDPIINGLAALKTADMFEYGGVNYDFADSDVDVIGVFSGHTHKDGNLTVNGINIICTTSDSYKSEQGPLTRTLGTVTEQAFDVVQIDMDSRKIYLTRIGAGSDREFNY